MKKHLPLIFLFTIIVWSLFGVTPGSYVSADPFVNYSGNSDLGEENGFVNTLLLLLKDVGVDLSYGEDGETVFSMVNTSLTRIITDLSSGNTEGFTDIPLINETLSYLHIAPEDIIVDPEEVQDTMPALDSYSSQYNNNNAHV